MSILARRMEVGLYMTVAIEDVVRDKLVVVALPDDEGVAQRLKKVGARDVLLLLPGGGRGERHDVYVRSAYSGSSRLGENNCEVAVLNGRSAYALRSRRYFGRFEIIAVPAGLGLFAGGPGLMAYVAQRGLIFEGTCSLPGSNGRGRAWLIFRNEMFRRNRKRLFGLSGGTALRILQDISDLDCVALRRLEDIESEVHEGDIDLLVSHRSLPDLVERLNRQVGTWPIDAHTDNGQYGHGSRDRHPYFPPEMAEKVLASAVVSTKGVRQPSPRWRFMSLCFHLYVHKSGEVAPGRNVLDERTFSKPSHYRELVRAAELAGAPVPKTFDEIEDLLRGEGVLPGFDTIGFRSRRNEFLKERYVRASQQEPGLCVFLVRDFGLDGAAIDEIGSAIRAAKFRVVAERPVDPMKERDAVTWIRGGNWADSKGRDGQAPPIYCFVCIDDNPSPPSRRLRRKYPLLDNENVRLKEKIRADFGSRAGARRLNLLHSSDNTPEAIEYLERLGMGDHPDVSTRLSSVRQQRAAS
jgi:hypothetical protein